MSLWNVPGNLIGAAGHALGLPEMGISEALGGNGGAALSNYRATQGGGHLTPQQLLAQVSRDAAARNSAPQQPDSITMPQDLAGQAAANQAAAQAAATARARANDIAYLNGQAGQLRDLLGRTDVGLAHGLTQNEDQYNEGVGGATNDKNKQVQTQTLAKQGAYDTIDSNAGNGYRSLAQIIGRASGTGSSAYQDLLPYAVGVDASSKRQTTTDTYGQNLSNIDTSFASVLADLLKQKKQNESNLRGGIESQRQGIMDQQRQVAEQLAKTNDPNADYGAIEAAGAPFQNAINNSKNAVEGFFNNFRTPYTAQPMNPNLKAYQTDRSVINAQNSGEPGDPNNPYSMLLRKKLQGVA